MPLYNTVHQHGTERKERREWQRERWGHSYDVFNWRTSSLFLPFYSRSSSPLYWHNMSSKGRLNVSFYWWLVLIWPDINQHDAASFFTCFDIYRLDRAAPLKCDKWTEFCCVCYLVVWSYISGFIAHQVCLLLSTPLVKTLTMLSLRAYKTDWKPAVIYSTVGCFAKPQDATHLLHAVSLHESATSILFKLQQQTWKEQMNAIHTFSVNRLGVSYIGKLISQTYPEPQSQPFQLPLICLPYASGKQP